MRRSIPYTGLVLAGLALTALSATGQSSPFTASDLVRLDRVGAPALSPAGDQVVFTLRRTDMQANRGRVDLWLAGTAGGDPRRLTSHNASDSQPAWSTDGEHIYFLSKRVNDASCGGLHRAGARPCLSASCPWTSPVSACCPTAAERWWRCGCSRTATRWAAR